MIGNGIRSDLVGLETGSRLRVRIQGKCRRRARDSWSITPAASFHGTFSRKWNLSASKDRFPRSSQRVDFTPLLCKRVFEREIKRERWNVEFIYIYFFFKLKCKWDSNEKIFFFSKKLNWILQFRKNCRRAVMKFMIKLVGIFYVQLRVRTLY